MKDKNTLYFAGVIFLSAFLIFQIQPIISKFILPWFGGTPSVWTVCMLFFQAVLFLGYAYAHLITSRSKPLTQVVIHGSLLLLSAFLVLTHTILPQAALKPVTGAAPVFHILLILSVAVGLPYFTLAATSPLLQFRFGRLHKEKEPYILYSVSNIGSLLALMTYPFLVEPMLPLKSQSWIWSGCFLVFAAGCGLILAISAFGHRTSAGDKVLHPTKNDDTQSEKDGRNPKNRELSACQGAGENSSFGVPREPAVYDLFQRTCWILLPMVTSILLLAVTNQLCTDVASGPFLWILPLCIYLLTFILTFTGWRFVYHREVFFILLVFGLLLVAFMLDDPGRSSLLMQMVAYSFVLYCGCTAMHGELYRLRPLPDRLTGYYMSISAGGAAGGLFVGLLAPVIFPDYYELHLSTIAILVLLMVYAHHDNSKQLSRIKYLAGLGVSVFLVLVVIGAFSYQVYNKLISCSEIHRNFFGVVRVEEKFKDVPDLHLYRLMHGSTSHGFQFIDSDRREEPSSYYSVKSGVKLALMDYPCTTGLHVGAAGLGIGTIAAYAKPGDEYRFYEINPEVISLAQNTNYFTYIRDARQRGAKIEMVPGDARLSMEKELVSGNNTVFDVIVLDAFSSDAIPLHLLTKEAFALYFRLLKEKGVLAVHITNRNIDLSPVILAMADFYRYHPFFIMNKTVMEEGVHLSRWILLSNNPYLVNKFFTGRTSVPASERMKRLWTDNFSSLWSLVKKKPLIMFNQY